MAKPHLFYMQAKRAGGGKPTLGGGPGRWRAVIAAIGDRHRSCGAGCGGVGLSTKNVRGRRLRRCRRHRQICRRAGYSTFVA